MLNTITDNEALFAANRKFNYELDKHIKGELPEHFIYDLGFPSDILLSTGIPDLKIEMNATRLQQKSDNEKHPYDLSEVKNLPVAIHRPIAVFKYLNNNAVNIITELEDKNDKKFLVGLFLLQKRQQNKQTLEINIIRNVFPKETYSIIHWINNDRGLYFDKERLLSYLDQQRTNHADVAFVLPDKNQVKQENSEADTTNLQNNFQLCKLKIQNFYNPKIIKGVYNNSLKMYLAPRELHVNNRTCLFFSAEIRNKLEETGKISLKSTEDENLSFNIKRGNKIGSYYVIIFNNQQVVKKYIKQDNPVEQQSKRKGIKRGRLLLIIKK